jgi:hypothetical protein
MVPLESVEIGAICGSKKIQKRTRNLLNCSNYPKIATRFRPVFLPQRHTNALTNNRHMPEALMRKYPFRNTAFPA